MNKAPKRILEYDPAEPGSTGIHAPLERVFATFPGSDRILEKLGFDMALNKETPLHDVCRIHSLDPKTVARMLAASCSTDPLPAHPTSTELMTLSDLCEHILQVDHVLLRNEFKRLEHILNEATAPVESDGPKVAAMQREVRAIGDNLAAHLQSESNELFPLIRKLENERTGRRGVRDRLKPLLPRLKREHDELDEALADLETSAARAPFFAKTGTQRALGQSLERIGRHFNEQVYRENQVLFRRVSAIAAFS